VTEQQSHGPSPEAVESVSQKLLQYRETLPEEEQQALDALMVIALGAVQPAADADVRGHRYDALLGGSSGVDPVGGWTDVVLAFHNLNADGATKLPSTNIWADKWKKTWGGFGLAG
jgi:hypothetical protein